MQSGIYLLVKYIMQTDKFADTRQTVNALSFEKICSWCSYLRPPALRKFSQKDLLLVLAISSSDVGMSFELNT